MPDDDHEHDLYGTGLLGDALSPKRTGNLAERFLIPPFTVFSAREGFWQNRKRAWIALGIQSELGRGGDLTFQGDVAHDLDHYRHKEGTRSFKDRASPGGSPMPAMDYKNRERGTGAGKPIAGTQAAVTAAAITVVAGVPPRPVSAGPRPSRAVPVTAAPTMPESSWRPPDLASLPTLRGKNIEFIGYDTETTGLNPRKDKIIGVSIAVGRDGPRFYLPFGHEGGDNLPEENVKQWLQDEIAPLRTAFVGAHLLFDLEFSARWGLTFPNATKFHDVLVAEPLIDEWQLSYSLEAIGLKYTGRGKDELLLKAAAGRYGWKTPSQIKVNLYKLPARYVGPYATEDADLPARVFDKQTAIMASEELDRVYEIERRQIPINLAMRLRGVPFNVPGAEILLDKLKAELKTWAERLQYAAGKPINFRGDDLGPALQDRGFALPLTATGKYSVTEGWLSTHRGDILIDAVLVCRRIAVLISYVESLLELQENGRLYPTFNQLRRTKDDGTGSGTIARYCLSGGSEIMVPGGIKNIENMKPGDLVYCYNDNKDLQLKKVLWSGVTGLRKIFKVEFKRGVTSSVRGFRPLLLATGDHKIRMYDGTYTPVKDLQHGQHVMSLHRSKDKGASDKLHLFEQNPNGRGIAEHRAIYLITHGFLPSGRGYHVHHINEDHFNHDPSNLELLTISEHAKHHRSTSEIKPFSMVDEKKRKAAVASAMTQYSILKNPPEKMLELFNLGHSVRSISHRMGASSITVAKRLLNLGVPHDKIPKKYWPNNHVVWSIEELPGLHLVYDLEIEDCHNFIANEICVHNSCEAPNLQQISKREKPADELIDIGEDLALATRKLFPAEEGEVYQRDDTSQAEFRINVDVAIGPGAEEARERYRTDPKISFHKMCGEMAGIDPTDKRQYDKIKGLNLGKSYGAQGKRIANILGCSLDEAKEFVHRYETALPFTVKTFNKAKEMADLNGFIRTYFGRRQRFPLWEPTGNRGEHWRPPLPREKALAEYGPGIIRSKTYAALNRYCQGSAADIFKKGLADMWDAGVFMTLGAPLLLVHDEIDISVPQTPQGLEAARELTRIMGECVTMRVPLLIETSQGPTWGHCG